ncbi:MAG: class I SAM-dependent methyltransferase [Caldilineaceae bacterium]
MSKANISRASGQPVEAVILKAGRDKPVRQRHPWIFSGAIQRLPATRANGEIVPIYSADGEWLAQGYLNRASQIQVRVLSWEPQPIDDAFWRQRLQNAIAGRQALATSEQTNAYRLINGESDYLPGLVVDRYSDYLVMQVGALGMEVRKVALAQQLLALTGCRGVVERSDLALRRQEGLAEATGLLVGGAPTGAVPIRECGFVYHVDLLTGQKSGFYTDQRENRRRVARYCAGQRVLNAFSYTGAFAIHALAAGATHVTNLDSSMEALTAGEANLCANGFDPDGNAQANVASIAGDVFTILRDWRAEQIEPFDLIILDPPKFAHSRGQVERALRGYKDINLLALQLLRPGGILATFSCSGLVSADLFQKVLFGAAVDAGRNVQILEWLHQGSDHPVAITFPEGEYLKGLLCRVL